MGLFGRIIRKTKNAVGDGIDAVGDGLKTVGISSPKDALIAGATGGLSLVPGLANKGLNAISGVDSISEGNEAIQEGIKQQQDQIEKGAADARTAFAPFAENTAADLGRYRTNIANGSYTPGRTAFTGPTSLGDQALPTRTTYQGKTGFDSPEAFKGLTGRTANLGGYALNGQSFDLAPAPTRQSATAENVQAYANPFLSQIIDQGRRAIEKSASGSGLRGSSAMLADVGNFATKAAQQNYNDAITQFNNNQSNTINDYNDTRKFQQDALKTAFDNLNTDQKTQHDQYVDKRDFDQKNFIDKRNFESDENEAGNKWNLDLADRRQKNFVDERKFNWDENEAGNKWRADAAKTAQGLDEGLVNYGFDSATKTADNATKTAAATAGLLGDAAQADADTRIGRVRAKQQAAKDALSLGIQLFK